MKTKICNKCKKKKPIRCFYIYRSGLNKGHRHSYCKECNVRASKEWRNGKGRSVFLATKEKYYKEHPWMKVYSNVYSRCNYGKYIGRVKPLITLAEIKKLWFRDKAYLLKKPSIDRINTFGNYTYKNCRFIELSENNKRPKNVTGRSPHDNP